MDRASEERSRPTHGAHGGGVEFLEPGRLDDARPVAETPVHVDDEGHDRLPLEEADGRALSEIPNPADALLDLLDVPLVAPIEGPRVDLGARAPGIAGAELGGAVPPAGRDTAPGLPGRPAPSASAIGRGAAARENR